MSMYTRAYWSRLKARLHPNFTCAEVGVAEGDTVAAYINDIVQVKGTLYCVDWWNGNIAESPFHQHGYNPIYKQGRKENFLSRFKNHMQHMVILDGVSWKMADQIPDNSLDFCFIDAGHTYDFCKADILAFYSKVKDDCILSGHDYSYFGSLEDIPQEYYLVECSPVGHVGVVKAVRECFGENFTSEGECWFVTMTQEIRNNLAKIKESFVYPETPNG